MNSNKPLESTSLKVSSLKFALFLIGIGVVVLLTKPLWEQKLYRPKEQIVFVDTKEIIRLASEDFAKTSNNSTFPIKKLEAYKDSLIQSLNEFGVQKNYLVFGTNQVFGNVPDVTEEFVTFAQQGKEP
jgi:homospermidine synthase